MDGSTLTAALILLSIVWLGVHSVIHRFKRGNGERIHRLMQEINDLIVVLQEEVDGTTRN